MRGQAPAGTIALLFTDIEGSTRLAGALGAAWVQVLADHHAIVGGAIEAEGGFVDGVEGDAFFATWADPAAAARAAVAALRGLRAHAWPEGVGALGVRMGLHVGHVERHPTGYVGLELHRAARIAAAAHGGQLLLSAAARAVTGSELEAEPLGLHRLKDFPAPEALFTAVIDGRGAAAFPPPRTQDLRPTNLPAGAPSLLGREGDLARVRAAFLDEGERLVTLTGRGGTGKTSLAIAAAAELLEAYPGGVWLARLATVDEPGGVLPAIAAAVGAEQGDEPLAGVAHRLRDAGATLLVLDNLEHLLPAAPEVVRLLDALPGLRVLATSQAPLRVPPERVLALDALDDRASLALIERVASRRAAPASGGDRAALLGVVHLLDGLPLALELAAARLAVLSPAQLRDRLRASVDVLRDASRDERQRSLRATAEWTLGLLDAGPRALFDRLGAFGGPVELAELEAVAGDDGLDVLDALDGLLEVALVRREERGDGRLRFGLPEALRQIAAERLDASGDGERRRRAHARRQRDIAWAARALRSTDGPSYRAAIEADVEAAAALRWARAHGDPCAAPLAAARGGLLTDFGRVREALDVLEPLVNDPTGDPEVDGAALVAYSYTLSTVSRLDESLAAADRALELAGEPMTRARGLLMRGGVRQIRGDLEAGAAEMDAGVAAARQGGPALLSGTLVMAAQAHLFAGHLDRAAELFAEGERIGAPVDCVRLTFAHGFRGDHALRSGDPEAALAHYRRFLDSAEARANGMDAVAALDGLAHALAATGRDEAALEMIGLSTGLMDELGVTDEGLQGLPGFDALTAAEERLGRRAAELRERGRGIAAGQRFARARELA